MTPVETGKAYDTITHLWKDERFDRSNGIAQHQRAIAFVENKSHALDVGCGCTGRFITLLIKHGFLSEGIDISQEMIKLARLQHPDIEFHHRDICDWPLPRTYDFITAWDSIWHVPLEQQQALLSKLLSALNSGGVLIFSCGGIDQRGEHTDDFMGPEVYYSSLGLPEFMQLILNSNCICRHIEYDQYPESHTYFIVQKN
jgi:SAM-dependent methyltransferase